MDASLHDVGEGLLALENVSTGCIRSQVDGLAVSAGRPDSPSSSLTLMAWSPKMPLLSVVVTTSLDPKPALVTVLTPVVVRLDQHPRVLSQGAFFSSSAALSDGQVYCQYTLGISRQRCIWSCSLAPRTLDSTHEPLFLVPALPWWTSKPPCMRMDICQANSTMLKQG